MMEEFNIADFKPVEFSDKNVLLPWILRFNPMSCEYNFANLYCWSDVFQIKWMIANGRLWIFNGRLNSLGFPLGRSISFDELFHISEQMRAANYSGNIIQVPVEYVQKYKTIKHYFHLKIDEPNTEYIYSVKKLLELPGRKLHRKKNLINQFLRNHPHFLCKPMQINHFEQCLSLTDTWCEIKVCDKIAFGQEMLALGKTFRKFDELEQSGLVLFTEGEMVAFSIFDRLNRNTADIHFEKYNPTIKGAAQIINRETAKHLHAAGFIWTNREQDLGQANLRRAKRSYQPDKLLKSYLLIRKTN